jgi:hypothetical protein
MGKHVRRAILGSLALAMLAAPVLASGCAAGFEPISQVDTLRVLAVVADKPYAQPGDQVTLEMTYDNPSGAKPLVAWVAGCVNPPGGQYYLCYEQLAPVLQSFASGQLPPGVGLGDTFTFTVPDMPGMQGILSPPACTSPSARSYGVAYVFFAVCNGTLGPAPSEGSGLAGSFPIGCFDSMGNPLGENDFVPGYTQVYAFCDKRTNQNPRIAIGDGFGGIVVQKIDADDNLVSGGTVGPNDTLDSCPVAEADRSTSGGCGKTDPYQACTGYQITVDVPDDVAEPDPSSTDMNGNELHEIVWVDYFADGGDIDSPVLLVSDATTGIQRGTDGLGNPQNKFATRWVAPSPVDVDGSPTTQTVNIWAVVHDSRGGETVATRQLTVQ